MLEIACLYKMTAKALNLNSLSILIWHIFFWSTLRDTIELQKNLKKLLRSGGELRNEKKKISSRKFFFAKQNFSMENTSAGW